MRGSFLFHAAILAISIAFSSSRAHASELCNPRDDKADLSVVEKFFESSLREHAALPFSRTIKGQAQAKAKALFVQDIVDKKAELCADRLRLAEEIKLAPSQYATADCASAAVVTLIDGYMRKVAGAYDGNVNKMAKHQAEHIRDLKLRLFEIAKGSTLGLEGVTYRGYNLTSAPKEVKFEWIKSHASKLAGEAHKAWGAVEPKGHPLVQLNLVIAREAVRVRNEREQQKKNLGTDGKLAPSCKKKDQ
jgi:hypothetical protein